MKMFQISDKIDNVSRIGIGCMRITGLSDEKAVRSLTAGCDRDGGIIEYARLKKMTLQAWSPFQYGMFEGIFIGNEKFPELNKVLDRLAEKYGVTQNAIAVAWIMRHPAGIQTIVGSTNLKRIQDISKASDIVLSREEWYEIYLAAGKMLP